MLRDARVEGEMDARVASGEGRGGYGGLGTDRQSFVCASGCPEACDGGARFAFASSRRCTAVDGVLR